MSSRKFLGNWYAGMVAGALVVGVVAALLLRIIATARSILSTARRALGVAEEIVTNTEPIWELDTTNAVAAQLLEGTKAIEQHATQVADALEEPQPAPQ